MGEATVQLSFVRKVLDSASRLEGNVNFSRVTPESVSFSTSGQPLPTNGQGLSLLDAETLLWAVDAAAGDGSGAFLERMGQDLGNRFFTHAGHHVSDLWTSMRRITGEFENAFANYPLQSSISRRDDGLEVYLVAPGQPRLARALRHLGIGYLRSAFTFAFEATSVQLRILSEHVGDRVYLTALYRTSEPAEPLTPPPPSPRRPATVPPASGRVGSSASVAAEVDRILSSVSGQWRRQKLPRSGSG